MFAGSADGHLRAYSTRDGRMFWSADTNGKFQNVNGEKAHGDNVLLAYGID